MASTLYIGFDRDDGKPNRRKEASLATVDLDRISVAYARLYFPEGVKETDEDGNETVREPTGEEVFDKLVVGLLNGMLANTVRVEKDMAAKAAQEAVTEIAAEIV